MIWESIKRCPCNQFDKVVKFRTNLTRVRVTRNVYYKPFDIVVKVKTRYLNRTQNRSNCSLINIQQHVYDVYCKISFIASIVWHFFKGSFKCLVPFKLRFFAYDNGWRSIKVSKVYTVQWLYYIIYALLFSLSVYLLVKIFELWNIFIAITAHRV